MPNMSYCRFENTLSALIDCLNAIEEDGMDTLESRYEKEAAESLLYTAKRFVDAYESARSEAQEAEMAQVRRETREKFAAEVATLVASGVLPSATVVI